MTWDHLSTLPPLRDEHGTIVLEEADDDTQTATFRIYGRTSLTATVTPTGEIHFDGEAPPTLRAATTKGSDPSISTQSPFAPPEAAGREEGSDPFISTQRGKWVAAGVAAAGIAVLAARRRR